MTRGLTLLTALLAALAVAIPASASEGRTLKGVLVSVTPTMVTVKDAKSIVTTCARADKSPSLDGYASGDRVQVACVRTGSKLVLAKIRHLTASSGTPSNDAQTTKFGGVVTALSDGSVSLHDGDHDLTCSIGPASPSTAGVKVGQHVTVACANGALVAIAPVTPATSGRAYEGTVSSVSATSITVHTAHGDGTCAVGDGSPSVADVKVGDRVLAGCKSETNQLVLLKKLPANTEPPQGQTGAGAISALSTSSVTFHNAEHDITCSLSASSPRLGDYNVGDKVKFGCLNGVLTVIAKDTSGTGTPTGETGAGTVSAVSQTSLTVHTDGGDVTCSVGDGSPSVAEVHVGDHVKFGCLGGTLKALVRSDATPPPPPPPPDSHTITVGGTLSALSSSSLTVHGEHGDVSCTVPATAHLGDFHVGDHVGMACTDGVLANLVKLS